jgi:hypothetical protein
MIHVAAFDESELRAILRRGVNPSLRRELETEIAWREHRGQHVGNRPHEYLPAFLLVDPAERRR